MVEQEFIEAKTSWSLAFVDESGSRALGYRVDQMTPSPSEIFTGKLPYTKSFFASIEAGSLALLRSNASLRFRDAIDLLGVLATHSNIARTGDFPLAAPGFWVRVPYGDTHILRGFRMLPVMPLRQLVAISGRSESELNDLLRPLLQDGAIRVMRNQDGTDGVLLNDGFVNLERIQGALRP